MKITYDELVKYNPYFSNNKWEYSMYEEDTAEEDVKEERETDLYANGYADGINACKEVLRDKGFPAYAMLLEKYVKLPN